MQRDRSHALRGNAAMDALRPLWGGSPQSVGAITGVDYGAGFG